MIYVTNLLTKQFSFPDPILSSVIYVSHSDVWQLN